MIGKAVWRLTCHQFSNINKASFSFGRLLNRHNNGGSAWPRLFSSSLMLQRMHVAERWPAQCTVVHVLQNWKILKCYCTSQSPDPSVVPWEEFEELVNANKVQIVDVREPEELQQSGRIGQAINIPVGEIADALRMTDDAFNSKYGQKKPDSSRTDIVFYCLAGIRSKKALDTAHSLGYTWARHFPGGWMEWAKQNNLPV